MIIKEKTINVKQYDHNSTDEVYSILFRTENETEAGLTEIPSASYQLVVSALEAIMWDLYGDDRATMKKALGICEWLRDKQKMREFDRKRKEKIMATSFCFDRGSIYGEAEFLSNLDPNMEYDNKQYKRLREMFISKVNARIERYDATLSWFPSTSEVWGISGKTESDREEFREWWKSGADGEFENALIEACYELDEEIASGKGAHKE